MTHVLEPHATAVEILKLRPTQISVGMREVAEKRQEWRRHAEHNGPDYLGRHMVPVILGPKGRLYLVDHHHLVRALHDEGVERVLTTVIADLSSLEKDEFWSVMDHKHWMYPFDENGKRQPHERFGKTVEDLVDDPYRSLAGSVRRVGGYAKDLTPFSEFMWADFFRRRIEIKLLSEDFDEAMKQALKLAGSPIARYLPGWCGVSAD